jgi:hypothetical protein
MLAGRPELRVTVAKLVGVKNAQLVTMWVSGKRYPADDCQEAMAVKLGIPVAAWKVWRPSAEARVAPAPAAPPPPASSPGLVQVPRGRRHPPPEAPPPDQAEEVQPPTVGTAAEQAQAVADWLAQAGRTPDEIAQGRARITALKCVAELTGARVAASKADLHKHPDWAPFVEDLIEAFSPIPGALEALLALLDRLAESKAAA